MCEKVPSGGAAEWGEQLNSDRSAPDSLSVRKAASVPCVIPAKAGIQNPLLGGVAPSDSGRAAPGWVFRGHNPP